MISVPLLLKLRKKISFFKSRFLKLNFNQLKYILIDYKQLLIQLFFGTSIIGYNRS